MDQGKDGKKTGKRRTLQAFPAFTSGKTAPTPYAKAANRLFSRLFWRFALFL